VVDRAAVAFQTQHDTASRISVGDADAEGIWICNWKVRLLAEESMIVISMLPEGRIAMEIVQNHRRGTSRDPGCCSCARRLLSNERTK